MDLLVPFIDFHKLFIYVLLGQAGSDHTGPTELSIYYKRLKNVLLHGQLVTYIS